MKASLAVHRSDFPHRRYALPLRKSYRNRRIIHAHKRKEYPYLAGTPMYHRRVEELINKSSRYSRDFETVRDILVRTVMTYGSPIQCAAAISPPGYSVTVFDNSNGIDTHDFDIVAHRTKLSGRAVWFVVRKGAGGIARM